MLDAMLDAVLEAMPENLPWGVGVTKRLSEKSLSIGFFACHGDRVRIKSGGLGRDVEGVVDVGGGVLLGKR